MALSATIFKVELSVSDIDHGYYEDHTLTVARHPSETDDRMTARVLAFAARAHRLAEVDAELSFGPGLSTPDTPDLLLADLSGRALEWVLVGQPDEKLLTKACKKADAVTLFPFSPGAENWWRTVGPRVAGLDRLRVVQLPAAAVTAVASALDRRAVVQVTVLDGTLSVTVGDGDPVELTPVAWQGSAEN